MGRQLASTPLHAWHVAHGARMVEFAGWSMPVHYTSIIDEHQATRTALGLFDISHMGRLSIDGPDAAAFLDTVVTRRVTDMRPGQIRYSLVTNESGGILDDVLISCQLSDDGAPLTLVVNAGNRAKIVAWLLRQRDQWYQRRQTADSVAVRDQTEATAMVAVQGPKATDVLRPLVNTQLAGMSYYTGRLARIAGIDGVISRTGYTGEDGYELIVPAEHAAAVWQAVLTAGHSAGARPAGLGCRDTLRLEAAMPLYGHELSPQIDPVQAGLMYAVNLEGRDFPGREAILRRQATPCGPRRVGLKLPGRRIPRLGCGILAGDQLIGQVTSGTFSPTLQQPIAMGYLQGAEPGPDAEIAVAIRGRREPASRVPLPFYTARGRPGRPLIEACIVNERGRWAGGRKK